MIVVNFFTGGLGLAGVLTPGPARDTTAPAISAVNPANGTVGVNLNTSVSATFSEAMNSVTLTSATFELTTGGSPVLGSISYAGTTATFTPSANLAATTIYTAVIRSVAADVAGNILGSDYTWTFMTGTATDITPPSVSSTNPVNGATGTAVNGSVSATFSEAMNAGTITGSTFTLMQGATPVAGNVSYAGTTATFIPSANLAYSTTYTASVTTGVMDLAGNALAADYTWTFTTGPAPDITPPTVSITSPVDGATGVAVNTSVSATFSEAMNAGTITTATITLKQGATPVAGTVNYAGTTATFTPSASLAFNTVYTATVTTGVTDLAGNPLSSDYAWTFTTGPAPDTTPPTVSSTSPLNGATGTAVNGTVSADFSETMNAGTITAATFTLKQGLTPIAGTVNYSGITAIFTPSGSLSPNTVYTATLTTGVTDLAGNPMSTDYTWSFTTGSTPDTTPPTAGIQNLRTGGIVHTGFVIGSAADNVLVSQVEVSIDGGGYSLATGTTSWSFQLPIGAATWRINSQHTIDVRSKDSSGNYSSVTSITLRKGNNEDVNGDGYADVVSSAPGYSTNTGRVYIFHSAGAGGVSITTAAAATTIITGEATDNFFGYGLALGDINGDGYGDLVASAYGYATNTGRLYVFHSSGSAGISITSAASATTVITGGAPSDYYGAASAIGDVNDDGYADVVTGAPGSLAGNGTIYVFHSSGSTGISATLPSAASTIITGELTSILGISLAVNDINGDGYGDLVAGASGYSTNTGRVYVFHSAGSSGIGIALASLASTILTGETIDNSFGFSLTTGDVNGDGRPDVVAGAPGYSSGVGRAYIFHASGGGIGSMAAGSASRIISGEASSFGISVCSGDITGDGYADVIVGGVLNANKGKAYVFHSSGGGGVSITAAASASTLIAAEANQDHFAFGIWTSDVNGDGYPDLIAGAYGNSSGAGRAYIFHSSASGIGVTSAASANRLISGEAASGFGAGVQ